MYGHISYILEPSSKRPNDFSLIRRKPNKILQFKVKKTYDIKIRAEIKFGIHAEGESNNKNHEGVKVEEN